MRHEHILAHLLSNPTAGTSAVLGNEMPLVGQSTSYTNELGSTMLLTFNSDGTLSGTYTSPVSSGGGSVTGSIVGWYNNYVLAWSVSWPTNVPAITSWVGAFISDSQGHFDIDTMWLLVSQAQQAGNPDDFWQQVNTGSDLFHPS